MKKIGLLLLTFLGLTSSFYAQQNWCGTDANLQKAFVENPLAAQQFDEHYQRISSGQVYGAERTSTVIIPVVVHVLHDNGVGNISYDQILSAIDMLNEDYNRLNADTIDTRNTTDAPFEPIAVSFDISFALAKLDPNGNCTNGVERRNSAAGSYNAADETTKYTAMGGLDAWPRENYLNIWVVNTIASDGSGLTTLGYAQFPQSFAGSPETYGLVVRNDAFGSIGTASGDRTVTHEIGHCLGLLHTFQAPFFGGGTGCHTADCGANGDYCCDTPPATEAHWSCPVSYNSCTSIPTNDPYGFDAFDQWENYMSYAPCQNMFSQGQFDIVSANLTTIAFLMELTSLANQTTTGVLLPEVLCQAAFTSDKLIICAGDSINFFDDSYFNVTGWAWDFPGGTTPSLADQNPTVTYNTAGLFDVTLEVTDGVSTVAVTLSDYIIVLPNPGDEVPYKEGFEQLTTVPDNDRFFVINDNGQSTWELNSTVAYSGYDCAYIENFGVTDLSVDELISGTIDLSGVDPADPMVFYFRYAYKRKTSADDERLKFYISKDCGENWSLRKHIHGAVLGPEVSSTAYVPADKSEWYEVNILNITDEYYVSDFRYKFEFENDGGNNFYLDHINMYPESMTQISEESEIAVLQVYPNPVTDLLTISFVSPDQANCQISIYDAVGNLVLEIYNGTISSGIQTFDCSTSTLANGIYMIKIGGENSAQTIKLIKN